MRQRLREFQNTEKLLLVVSLYQSFNFFVLWHINPRGLFNARALLAEVQLRYYLNYSLWDKSVQTFPRGIRPKTKVVPRLESEVTARFFSHFTMQTPTWLYRSFQELEFFLYFSSNLFSFLFKSFLSSFFVSPWFLSLFFIWRIFLSSFWLSFSFFFSLILFFFIFTFISFIFFITTFFSFFFHTFYLFLNFFFFFSFLLHFFNFFFHF